jgi:hypothetical protein
MLLPLLTDPRVPNLEALALGFLVWSALVWWIIRQPVRWIYRHRVDDPEPRHVDAQLTKLETRVRPFVRVGQAVAVLAALLSLIPVVM